MRRVFESVQMNSVNQCIYLLCARFTLTVSHYFMPQVMAEKVVNLHCKEAE